MDRRLGYAFGAVVFLGAPIAAFMFGSNGEFPTEQTLREFFYGPNYDPHPETVVLPIADFRVMAFDRDHWNVYGEIEEKQELIKNKGTIAYGEDGGCLNSIQKSIDAKQLDLDKLYSDYMKIASMQGGTVTEEQDRMFRNEANKIHKEIQFLLYHADSVAGGLSPVRCA